ncbi:MAG TPA: hypothetical protein V6C89_00830 [Drouetiella sp.]|jgi:hypothetical protein
MLADRLLRGDGRLGGLGADGDAGVGLVGPGDAGFGDSDAQGGGGGDAAIVGGAEGGRSGLRRGGQALGDSGGGGRGGFGGLHGIVLNCLRMPMRQTLLTQGTSFQTDKRHYPELVQRAS